MIPRSVTLSNFETDNAGIMLSTGISHVTMEDLQFTWINNRQNAVYSLSLKGLSRSPVDRQGPCLRHCRLKMIDEGVSDLVADSGEIKIEFNDHPLRPLLLGVRKHLSQTAKVDIFSLPHTICDLIVHWFSSGPLSGSKAAECSQIALVAGLACWERRGRLARRCSFEQTKECR
jgi:hypothetical protein